jgi:hypothetical protein
MAAIEKIECSLPTRISRSGLRDINGCFRSIRDVSALLPAEKVISDASLARASFSNLLFSGRQRTLVAIVTISDGLSVFAEQAT